MEYFATPHNLPTLRGRLVGRFFAGRGRVQQYGELVGLLWTKCNMFDVATARVQCRDYLRAVVHHASEPLCGVGKICTPLLGNNGFSSPLIATEPHLVNGLFLLKIAAASLP